MIRHHVETLRRLKYRPTGGFAAFCFADGHARPSRGRVLDHDRGPKPAYHALVAACRPGDRGGRPCRPSLLPARQPPRPRRARRQRPPRRAARRPWSTATAPRPVGGAHHRDWQGDVPADALRAGRHGRTSTSRTAPVRSSSSSPSTRPGTTSPTATSPPSTPCDSRPAVGPAGVVSRRHRRD